MKNKFTSYLVKTAMLSALAFVLLLIEIPLPFLPTPWLKLNISDLPALLGGFMLGPVAGTIISVVKVLLFALIRGTSTGFIGELSNICIGILYVLPASLLYMKWKSRRGAACSLLVGSLFMVATAMLTNYYIMYPLYFQNQAVSAVIMWGTLGFNLIKVTLTSLLTFLLYKRLHTLFNKL